MRILKKQWNHNKFENNKSHIKKYFQQYEEENIEKKRKTRHTNANCRETYNIRRQIFETLKGILESTSKNDLIGIDTEVCVEWIEF